jgi:hypothetical protein
MEAVLVNLAQAQPGDVIRIATHHPREVTVGGLASGALPHLLLSWQADGEHGTTALADCTQVELVSRAPGTDAGETAGSPVREEP